MVVAARAGNGLAEKRLGDNIKLLVDHINALLLLVGLGEHLRSEREQSKRGNAAARARIVFGGRFGGLGQEVARELLNNEVVEGQVAVEGVDHIVAVVIRIGEGDIFVDAVGVGVARDIEPMPAPALAVHLRLEHRVDAALVGVRPLIAQEIVDIFGRGRHANEVERRAAQKSAAIGFGRGREAFALKSGENEAVDLVARPSAVDHGRNRWMGNPLVRPMRCKAPSLLRQRPPGWIVGAGLRRSLRTHLRWDLRRGLRRDLRRL